jgi:iron complex transport system substrate-binding protein
MAEGFESISFEVLPWDYVFVYNGDGDNYHDEFVMEDPFSLELQLDKIVNLLIK